MKEIPNVHDLHNILILLEEGSLSDALLSSCCYREIKKANPQVKITAACCGPAYDYLVYHPCIDEVIKLPWKHSLQSNQQWLSLCRTALKLRKNKYDLVLDNGDKDFYNWRLFKWLIGRDRVLDCFTSPVKPFGDLQKHATEHERAILGLLGVENPDTSYELPIDEAARQTIRQWLKEHQISKYILLSPCGSDPARCFRPDVLQGLCVSLKELKLPLVVPTPVHMQSLWQQALADIPHTYVKPIANVCELFELVHCAAGVVTPDTSVVHIAAGFQKPSLVFRNIHSAYYAPNNPNALVLETDHNDINQFNWWKMTSLIQRLQAKL